MKHSRMKQLQLVFGVQHLPLNQSDYVTNDFPELFVC